MNDHDPENLRATDRKMRTSQATIAMPNGSHQQLGQHTRCNILPHAVAPLCAKPTVDTGACLIDAVLTFLSSGKVAAKATDETFPAASALNRREPDAKSFPVIHLHTI